MTRKPWSNFLPSKTSDFLILGVEDIVWVVVCGGGIFWVVVGGGGFTSVVMGGYLLGGGG